MGRRKRDCLTLKIKTMANQVKSCVPQKENSELYLLYVQSTFEFNADNDAEYKDEYQSLTGVTINYKLSSDPPTRAAGVYSHTKNVALYESWKNLPTTHTTTTNLYDTDGVTLINSESMKTKDGPILR